jgi:hypothetical protein
LNEVYHVTDNPSTIPFNTLPNEFVIKGTHGSGYIIIIKDKTSCDFEKVRTECRKWLSEQFGGYLNEYWYDEIKPQVIVEDYIDVDDRVAPLDYKFYVFSGQVKYIHVDIGRFSQHTRRFYDREWTPMEFEHKYPVGPEIQRPDRFEKMIDIAEAIGEDFEFVRVDLFNTNDNNILFGEMTLSPEAGQGGFRPTERDFELGSYWSSTCLTTI